MKQFLNESILDIPKTMLDQDVFDEDVLRPSVTEKIFESITELKEISGIDFNIEKIYIIGSILTKFWSSNSDIDVNVLIDFEKEVEEIDGITQEELRFKLLSSLFSVQNEIRFVENHPINLYISDLDHEIFSKEMYDVIENKHFTNEEISGFQIDREANLRKTLEIKQKSHDIIDFLSDTIRDIQIHLIDYKFYLDELKHIEILDLFFLDHIYLEIERLKDILEDDYKYIVEILKTLRKIRIEGLKTQAGIFSAVNMEYKILEKYGILQDFKNLKNNIKAILNQ